MLNYSSGNIYSKVYIAVYIKDTKKSRKKPKFIPATYRNRQYNKHFKIYKGFVYDLNLKSKKEDN